MDDINKRSPEINPSVPAQEKQEVLVSPDEALSAKPKEVLAEVKITPSLINPIAQNPVVQPVAVVPEAQKQVEHILSEGLASVYKSLPPQSQEKFRILGEQTAQKITVLMSQAKVQFVEVLKLIRDWLFTLPGVNKFFVEQEAKIKADKILRLKG